MSSTPTTQKLLKKIIDKDEKVKLLTHELCIVTGASQGLGRYIALEFAKRHVNYDFLLIARNEKNLQDTKDMITPHISQDAKVFVSPIDLSDCSTVAAKLESAFDQLEVGRYRKATLVNNAGTYGEPNFLKDITNFDSFQSNICLNITSYMYLASLFLRRLASGERQCVVVNISSGMAYKAFPASSLYCVNRAARSMMMAVLTKEIEELKLQGQVRLLNYGPGVVHTHLHDLVQANMVDCSTKAMFTDVISQGKAVPIEISVAELMTVLEENKYENGAFEDFYVRKPSFCPF